MTGIVGHVGMLMNGSDVSSLDAYTTNLWAAYAIKRLLTSYAGALIRVRRSSDNTEQDIGQSADVLDTASLATFVGASDAFIVTWYDQSGNGNDLSQATTSKQPMIVDAGAYLAEILWYSSRPDRLVTTNNSGTPNAFTVYFAGRNRQPPPDSSSAFAALINRGDGNFGMSASAISSSPYFCASIANTVGDCRITASFLVEDGSTFCQVMDLSQGTVGTQHTLYRDGTFLSHASDGGSVMSPPFAAATWNLSSVGTADTNNARMAMQAFLIYEAAHDSSTVSNISALVRPAIRYNTMDSYASGCWAIYWLRKLVTAYAGPCIRVRRSSDNTEQDIGFSSDLLDTASLLSFVGAGSGYITKWYDQSGAAHDAVQATQANQPRIVNAGVLESWGIYGDGSAYFLTTPSSSSRATFTYYIKARNNNAGGIRTLLQLSALPIGNSGCCMYQNNESIVVVTGSPSQYNFRAALNAPVGQVLVGRHDHSSSNNSTNAQILSGGGLLTTSNVLSGGTLSGNFNANAWQVMKGDTGGGANYFLGWMEGIVIREALDSDADADRISQALG